MTAAREATGWRAVLREWRETAFVYLLIPIVQTGFLVSVGAVSLEQVPEQTFVIALVTGAVGLLIAPSYLLLLEPLAQALGLPAGPLTRWILRLSAVGLGLLGGAELAVRGLAAFSLLGDAGLVRWQILRAGVVIAAVVTAILAMRASAERRQAAMAEQVERARLQALQARTEPHFLYNTLNTVAALIPTDPVAAEEAVLRLSELLRYVLERRERVPLRDELKAVDDYLAIEALRMGARLRVVKEIEPDSLDIYVPPLVLQPLVENAVLHGISGSKSGGTVTIKARREGTALRLIVLDDGTGALARPSSGTGLAHEELRRRVGALGELQAGPRMGGGYEASVRVSG